jgi:hypothetical protein
LQANLTEEVASIVPAEQDSQASRTSPIDVIPITQ